MLCLQTTLGSNNSSITTCKILEIQTKLSFSTNFIKSNSLNISSHFYLVCTNRVIQIDDCL